MKLFYRQVGETGPAIIILHGIFGSSDNWLTTAKTIAESGFRVFLLDQRNHGRSPRSDVFDYESMGQDLLEFIQDHQLDKPILVGHSMGGKVVMQFAMDHPNQYSKLVIVDIAPKFYPVHHGEILRGLNAIPLAHIKSRTEADELLTPYEPSYTVRQFLLKNLYRNEQGEFDWRLNLPVIEREIHGVGEELRHPHPVTEPTLFIRGADSGYIRDEDLPNIQQLFPHVSVKTIQDAGHWVQAEQPEKFVEALIQFVV